MPNYICKIGFNGVLWVSTNAVIFHWIYKSYLASINSRCVTKCGETNKE